MSYMRSEILALTRVLGEIANLRLSPGGTKPESEGMFQREFLWCRSEPRHADYCEGIISSHVVFMFCTPPFPFPPLSLCLTLLSGSTEL